MIPFIVALPLLFAFLTTLLNAFEGDDRIRKLLFVVGILSPWPIFLMNIGGMPVSTIAGNWERISGIEVVLNEYNYYFILGELIVLSAVGLYSLRHTPAGDGDSDRFSSRYVLSLMLLLHGGMLGAFVSSDLFNFYVYMEISSLASIILVSCSREKGARRASYRYLMLYLLSSFFFIFAIGLTYAKTGYLNFYLIQEQGLVSEEIQAAVAIAMTSLLVKAGIFPLHFWLPEAHSKADTPVSAVLSGVVVKVPMYGAILFLVYSSIAFIADFLLLIAFASMFFGIFMALLQDDAKKLLAYHTVSQMGFVLLGIALLDVTAAIFYAFAHMLFKSGLFLGVGALIGPQRTKSLDDLSYRGDKLLMGAILFLSLAIGGVSPFIGGFCKEQLLSNLHGLYTYLFYMAGIGTLVSFIKLNYKLSQPGKGSVAASHLEKIAAAALAALTLIFGLYFYPEVKYLDIFLLLAAIAVFFVLNYLGVFRKNIPRFFGEDDTAIGQEINVYTSVFVLLTLLFLLHLFY
ncbi:MAG: proton-conducting transporter membrane subunit [Thermoplasmatota archaeon]